MDLDYFAFDMMVLSIPILIINACGLAWVWTLHAVGVF